MVEKEVVVKICNDNEMPDSDAASSGSDEDDDDGLRSMVRKRKKLT